MKLNYGSSPLSLGGQDRRVRGVVFDSGSSYTYFPKEAYSELVSSVSIFHPQLHGVAKTLISKLCR